MGAKQWNSFRSCTEDKKIEQVAGKGNCVA